MNEQRRLEPFLTAQSTAWFQDAYLPERKNRSAVEQAGHVLRTALGTH